MFLVFCVLCSVFRILYFGYPLGCFTLKCNSAYDSG
jgi:hypothetical protein